MKKQSAGLLVYKIEDKQIKVLVAHMGGPWFAKKEQGSWTIPKGEYDENEEPMAAAKREFKEELGQDAPEGEYLELGVIEQKNNKQVIAWGVQADLDVTDIHSNSHAIEWPPKSGKQVEFPEIDRAEYLGLAEAAKKLISGQAELLERLRRKLNLPWQAEPAESEKPAQSSLF